MLLKAAFSAVPDISIVACVVVRVEALEALPGEIDGVPSNTHDHSVCNKTTDVYKRTDKYDKN